jgi:hypothetical protein
MPRTISIYIKVALGGIMELVYLGRVVSESFLINNLLPKPYRFGRAGSESMGWMVAVEELAISEEDPFVFIVWGELISAVSTRKLAKYTRPPPNNKLKRKTVTSKLLERLARTDSLDSFATMISQFF